MKVKPISYLQLLLLIFFGTADAQQPEQESALLFSSSSPLVYAQQDIVHSEILNQDRKINIFLPDSFDQATAKHTYPVILLLEDEFFLMVAGVVNHLSSVERMPETIVVSIVDGPQVPTLYTNGSDFWPKDWKQLPFGENPDPFTAHLKEELFPYLKNNYRANDFSIVMGLSGTSIYALHSFVKEPGLFDGHIAIASGDILGMGYTEGETLIDLIVDDVKKSPKKSGYLYITSADSDGGGNSPMIKANLEELEQRLSPYRSDRFHFISKIFPDESHYGVALPALEEALEMIFPEEKWNAQYREIIKEPGTAMNNIDDYYKNLSTEYGFEIWPRAERWNSVNRLSWIGPDLMKQENFTEAIEVIERWVEYRPNSAVAPSELSKAYEAIGDLNKALNLQEKAYEISIENEQEDAQEYLNEMSRLKILMGKK